MHIKTTFCIIVLLFSLLMFSSCSDLLFQVGEQGDAQIGITDGYSFSLQLVTNPESSGSIPTVNVASGDVVVFTAVVQSSDEDLNFTYRWFLDGEALQETSSEATIEAYTLELDTRYIPIGTSEVKAVVHEETKDILKELVVRLVISERPS